MTDETKRPVGLTKDVGFQIGVRRTLPLQLEAAWQLLTSAGGRGIWLGAPGDISLTKGDRYKLEDGSTGEVRVFKPLSHLRITWQPHGWPRASTITVRVIPKDTRTVIAFHQENLPGATEREERRAHFAAALDKFESIIQP